MLSDVSPFLERVGNAVTPVMMLVAAKAAIEVKRMVVGLRVFVDF